MARRFGRFFENPERRIEKEGDFTQITESEKFDAEEVNKRLDAYFNMEKPSKREQFVESIKLEPSQEEETPLTLAYKELYRARQSGEKDDIIRAEDRILDLERKEQELEYKLRMSELKQMQKDAREENDEEKLKRFSQMRRKLIAEMDYNELNYQINKLQNSQRLSPSPEKLKQIVELKKELEVLEQGEMSK